MSEEESRVFYRENSMVEKSGIVDMVGIEKGGELVAIIDLECDERKDPVRYAEFSKKMLLSRL